MKPFPVDPKVITVSKDMKSLTVNDRGFADVLKGERTPAMPTPVGPIPWDKVRIDPNGNVTIFDEKLTSLIDEALRDNPKPTTTPRPNPYADWEVNIGGCQDLNVGSCK